MCYSYPYSRTGMCCLVQSIIPYSEIRVDFKIWVGVLKEQVFNCNQIFLLNLTGLVTKQSSIKLSFSWAGFLLKIASMLKEACRPDLDFLVGKQLV